MSRQRSSASCSRAFEVVHSVRERQLSGSASKEEQCANFAPYGLTSSSKKGITKNKPWSIKMYCSADKNVVRVPCTPSSREMLVEAGLGPKTICVFLCSSPEEFREVFFLVIQSSRMVGASNCYAVSLTPKIWMLFLH